MDRKSKVLHIVDGLDPSLGGVAKAVENIASGLSKRGVLNDILSLDEEIYIDFESLNIKVINIGSGKGPWNYNSHLRPWLKENYKSYDAFVVHGLWLYKNFRTYKELRNSEKKLFIMPHGMLDPYFQKTDTRKLKALRNKIYWKFIESKIINSATGLLFTCEEEMLLARKTFPKYQPKKEYIVSLGVSDPLTNLNDQKQKDNGSAYYLFLSRIHEKKGLDILIESYEKLLQNNQDQIYVPNLIIAGPGEESAYGKAIKKKVLSSRLLKNKVSFIGMILGEKKIELIKNAELFILPSHQENFGIAIVEALACYTPVLITNKVNIWREIQNGEGGVVTNDNEEALSISLNDWITLPESEKVRFRENARNVFENNFTIEVASEMFLKVL